MENTNLNNIFRYASLNANILSDVKVVAYIPEITDAEYNIGYIVRYFVQKTNDDNSPIFEVDAENLTQVQSDPYYKTTSLKWRITGTPQEIMDSNQASIKLAYIEMKNLKLYLSNLLQFARV
jgi:hypothetical protein